MLLIELIKFLILIIKCLPGNRFGNNLQSVSIIDRVYLFMAETPTARYFKILAGHTIVFGLSTLVRPLSQLLLVRLHTNTYFVQVEEYAAWTLLQVALNIGVVLLNMGLATAFFRHFLLANNDLEKKEVVGRSFRLTLFLSIFGGGLLYLLAGLWSKLLIGHSEFLIPAQYVAIAIAGNTLGIIPLALLRAEGKGKLYVAFNLLRFFSLIGLNAWFLIWLNMGLEGITLALAITNVGTAVLFLPVLRGRMISESFSKGWKVFLRYGIPLIAIDVTLYVINGIPHILLNILRSPQDVALFGFGLRIAFIAQVAIVMPFYIAFGPQLFRAQRDEEDPKPLYARTMGYIWTIAAFIALFVTLFSSELASLLGKNPLYHEAVPFVPWLSLGVVFYGIFVVFSSGASLKDKTWVFPLVLLAAGLIEGILGAWWINSYGAIGAAWAVFTGYGLLAIFTYVVNQFVYPISFPWKRVYRVAAVVIIILFCYYRVEWLQPFGFRILLFAAFPLLLLVTGYLDEGERSAVKRWISRK